MGIRFLLLAFVGLWAAFAAPAATAGEFSLVVNGLSYHWGSEEDWNEENYGLGLEYQFTSESRWKKLLLVNGFRDSNDDMSYMAGGGLYRNLLQTGRFGDMYVDLGINAFLMTRTDINNNNPFPAALPSLVVGNRFGGINLSYMPGAVLEKVYGSDSFDQSIRGVFFLQLKFRMNALGDGQ